MQSSSTILKNIPLFYIAFGLLVQLDCLCNLSGYVFMKRNHPIEFVPEDSRMEFIRLIDKIGRVGRVALYRCSCGVEKEVCVSYVNNGYVKSCGCFTKQQRDATALRKTTHGLSKKVLYRIYRGIIKRCEYEKCIEYPRYGGRGVTMCKEWRDDFKLFYEWALLNGWRKGLHVDKDVIPKRLGIPAIIYSPEMCSIITQRENSNAVCNNIEVSYLGKKQNLSQWCDELNLDYRFVWQRIKLGWSAEKALATPKRTLQDINNERRKIILNIETGIFYFGAKEVSELIGISVTYMNQKLTGRQPNNTPFRYV